MNKKILWFALLAILVGFLMQAKDARSETVNRETPDIRTYSIERVLEKWGGGQWTYLNELIYRESKWNPLAQNPKSSAFGLCQFLNSTWEGEKTSDPYKQIDECLVYIVNRYGTPEKALRFHDKHNWY